MRPSRLLYTIALVVFASCASGAFAQDYPDMLGTWKGQADAIVLGNPIHFEDGSQVEQPRVAGFEITIAITGQEGRYIWGTISGGGATEPWLGSLWSDGSGYRAVDSNGHVDGRIISDNEIENCYTHTGETIVASCAMLTRQ